MGRPRGRGVKVSEEGEGPSMLEGEVVVKRRVEDCGRTAELRGWREQRRHGRGVERARERKARRKEGLSIVVVVVWGGVETRSRKSE